MKSNFYNNKPNDFFGVNGVGLTTQDLKEMGLSLHDLEIIHKYKQQHKEAQNAKQYAYDEKGNKIEMSEHFLPPFTP